MENQRVRISKMLLKEALIRLLYDKKIEKITVSELCEKAGINRSTFYKHYGSQFEVLEDVEKDLLDAATNMLTYEVEDGKSGICRFLSFLKEKKEMSYVIIDRYIDSEFIRKIFEMPALQYFSKLKYDDSLTKRQNEYLRIFEYNGGFALIKEWVVSGFPEEPEEIEDLLIRISADRIK